MANIKRPIFNRKKIHDKYYDSTSWRKTTKSHRKANPFCFYCIQGVGCNPETLTLAYATDHQLPRRLFPELEDDPQNLKSICKRHDGIKRSIEAQCHTRAQAITKLRGGGFIL